MKVRPVSCPVHSATSPEGFTLLEVLVSLVMITIVVVSVYRLHSQTIEMNFRAQFLSMAPFLAGNKLAELELSDKAEWNNEDGAFNEPHSKYLWRITVDDVDFESEEGSLKGLKRVNVSVSHQTFGYRYNLQQYIFFKGDE